MSVNSSPLELEKSAAELVAEIRGKCGKVPMDVGLVLGSGWSQAVEVLGAPLAAFDFADWPCFPADRIAGHAGRLHVYDHGGKRVLAFLGRFHCYQGLTAYGAALPVRLAAALDCRSVLLCCATGGINPVYRPGDLVYVTDHINLIGDNPLCGLIDDPFIDLSKLYDQSRHPLVSRIARSLGLSLHQGVLAAMPGPSYETPAEIRMLAGLGADVVSMSTVPEAIMAAYLDIEVTAIALVANPAAGIGDDRIEHADVIACGDRHADRLGTLMASLVTAWS